MRSFAGAVLFPQILTDTLPGRKNMHLLKQETAFDMTMSLYLSRVFS